MALCTWPSLHKGSLIKEAKNGVGVVEEDVPPDSLTGKDRCGDRALAVASRDDRPGAVRSRSPVNMVDTFACVVAESEDQCAARRVERANLNYGNRPGLALRETRLGWAATVAARVQGERLNVGVCRLCDTSCAPRLES